MVEFDTPTLTERETWSGIDIDRTPIYVGAGLIVLVSLTALMVPLFAVVGGGIVGGFVAAYLTSGPVRGLVHGTAAGLVAGIGHGVITALIGSMLGLYMEPPTLVGWITGPIAPGFAFMGPLTSFLILVAVALMVAADAAMGAAAGATLRTLRDQIA